MPHKPKRSGNGAAPAAAAAPARPKGPIAMLSEEAESWWLIADTALAPTTTDAAAADALAAEVEAFEKARKSALTGDDRFMDQVLRSGTAADRVAAMTLAVAEAPVQRLGLVDNLLAMASNKQQRLSKMAIEALADLFSTTLLPPDRPLLALNQVVKPAAAPKAGKKAKKGAAAAPAAPSPADAHRVALMRAFEHELKRRYGKLIECIRRATSDQIKEHRLFGIAQAAMLFASKPEGEADFLPLLVNKLGDPERRVAAAAASALRRVLEKHLAMTPTVAHEVAKFALRANLPKKSLYDAVNFLNQVRFRRTDSDLASTLVSLYLGLFERSLQAISAKAKEKKSQRKKDRDLAVKALDKAAAPAADKATRDRKKSGERALARKRRRAPGGAAAPKGAGAGAAAAAAAAPESLETKMLSALLTGINRARPYLAPGAAATTLYSKVDVLFRVVHAGTLATRVQAITLLWQLAGASTPETAAAAAAAAAGAGAGAAAGEDGSSGDADADADADAAASAAALTHRVYRALYGQLDARGPLGSASKPTLLLNVLYRAMRDDADPLRVAAFAKRLVQVSLLMPPAFAAAALLILSEVRKAQPVVARMLKPLAHGALAFPEDAPTSQLALPADYADVKAGAAAEDARAARAAEAAAGGGEGAAEATEAVYDGTKRDPRFAVTGGAPSRPPPLWEAALLRAHAHPSVATFAKTLLDGQPIEYGGDPLVDLALVSFLDRFSYRNPKSREKRGAEMSEAMMAQDGGADEPEKPQRQPRRAVPERVNTAEFAAQPAGEVAADQAFYHRFFTERFAREKRAATGKDSAEVLAAAKRRLRGDDGRDDDVLPGREVFDGGDDEVGALGPVLDSDDEDMASISSAGSEGGEGGGGGFGNFEPMAGSDDESEGGDGFMDSDGGSGDEGAFGGGGLLSTAPGAAGAASDSDSDDDEDDDLDGMESVDEDDEVSKLYGVGDDVGSDDEDDDEDDDEGDDSDGDGGMFDFSESESDDDARPKSKGKKSKSGDSAFASVDDYAQYFDSDDEAGSAAVVAEKGERRSKKGRRS